MQLLFLLLLLLLQRFRSKNLLPCEVPDTQTACSGVGGRSDLLPSHGIDALLSPAVMVVLALLLLLLLLLLLHLLLHLLLWWWFCSRLK